MVIPTLDNGGAEKQLCLLVAGLPKAEFDVHVVVLTRMGPRDSELRAANIPVHFIGKSHKFDPSSMVRLVRTIRRLRPDVVHSWIFAANCYARVAAKYLSVPRIVAGERCVDLWKTGRHLAIDRMLAKFTDAIITNSSGVVDFYSRRGVPERLFHVIPNGIAARNAPTISAEDAFQRFGLGQDRIVIGAVGRLWPQKRYRDLICAADVLGVVQPKITLVVIGDGPQGDELLRYRDQVTDPDWVKFLGNRSDVAELLPHFSLFWLGSEYEGQSNSMLEAMQVGLPIVATDIPGNRDLIVSNKSGILVPVGDSAAMAKQSHYLLQHVEISSSFGEAAKRRVTESFSVEQMVSRHAELYRKLL